MLRTILVVINNASVRSWQPLKSAIGLQFKTSRSNLRNSPTSYHAPATEEKAMNFITTFIQSGLLFMILKVASTYAQCNSSAIGYALVGHVYKNFSAPSPFECYSTCKKEEPECRSFNYHEDKTVCELSTHSNNTRPADFQISERAVYFHSCYRERLASKPSFAANNCAEIISHEESVGDGWYWLRTGELLNETAMIYCNMTNKGNMASSFDLIFPPVRNTSNYAIIDAFTSQSQLDQFTVSLWFKTTEKILVPISYAAGNEMNSILLFIDETGLLRFLVVKNLIDGYTGNFDDNTWHHVVATWENTAGHAQVFVDGHLKIDKTGVHVNGFVAGGGKLVLGLDQDTLGGTFDVEQSFVGALTHVYLWNTALKPEVITQMAHVCKEFPHPGHVMSWSDIGASFHGEITRRNYSRCRNGDDNSNIFSSL